MATSSFGVPWPEFNDGLYYSDVVRSADSGKTLIEFYSSKYRNSAPLLGWLQRISNSQVAMNGKVVTDPGAVLVPGCEVVYRRLPWREPEAPWSLQVLYEDDHMVAVNKPSGLQVLPGGLFQQRCVLSQLQWGPWTLHPAPVHRLGRGTSGVLLCAKTKLGKARLSAYFAKGTSDGGEDPSSRSIRKFYRALVVGLVEDLEIVVDQPIGPVCYPGVANGLYVASSSGRPALSNVRVLERDTEANQTRVQVEIRSGRPHQIRIHMAFIGHPLLGDPLYGVGGCPEFSESAGTDDGFAEDGGYNKPVRPVPGDCGYHLHAHRVVLCHPSTDETVEINCSVTTRPPNTGRTGSRRPAEYPLTPQ